MEFQSTDTTSMAAMGPIRKQHGIIMDKKEAGEKQLGSDSTGCRSGNESLQSTNNSEHLR